MTVTETRSIPSAAEARVHPLAKTVRNAARAAARDERPYFVAVTYTRYAIEGDESACAMAERYFRVYADRAEVVERSYR